MDMPYLHDKALREPRGTKQVLRRPPSQEEAAENYYKSEKYAVTLPLIGHGFNTRQ
jgi:hypothetical protein